MTGSATWLGADRAHFERCGSTNDEAAALAKAGAEHGTIVTADAQTAGRGRGSNEWFSPPGTNLYLSCILRPTLPPAQCPPLSLAAGLGVWDAVNSYGVAASLKWPNDVFVGRRKLAGILTEMTSRGGAIDYVIVGIGVNLNQTEFPDELARTATSLSSATSKQIDRDVFVEQLLGACERWFERLDERGLAGIRDRWNERALRARVRVTSGSDVVEGTVDGIDDSGALCVIDGDGRRHTVIAGDVMLLDD